MREAFRDLIPDRPYCSDDLSCGLVIRHRDKALERRHIQFNGPSAVTWITSDIDTPESYFAYRDANLPEPNVMSINPDNGRGHGTYLLAVPVAAHSASRLKPLQYLAAVQRGITRRLGADRGYVGLIAKNPLHPDWRTEWRRDEPFTLDELADWLWPRDMKPYFAPQETFGFSRNCTVFDDLRKLAYREVRDFKRSGARPEAFRARLIDVATGLNLQFQQPLNHSEVRAIAKSVSKWTWKNFSLSTYSRIKSEKGKLGNAIRWKDRTPLKVLRPWEKAGITRYRYYKLTKEQRLELLSDTAMVREQCHTPKPPSVEQQKPWEAEGISRRTWYRRQKAALAAQGCNP